VKVTLKAICLNAPYPQQSHAYLQKSLIYSQKSPVYLQALHIYKKKPLMSRYESVFDMTHPPRREITVIGKNGSCCHDSTFLTWRTHTTLLFPHDKSFSTWLTWMCDMTHSDAFVCDMTHAYVRHDSHIRATWPTHTCDVTHTYVRRDPHIRATWPTHTCEVTLHHRF